MANSDNNVAYIVSSELIVASSQLPSNKGRSSTVHSLIHAFGLSKCVKVIRPIRASYKDLAVYHTRDYLDAVLSPPTSTTPNAGELNDVFGLDSDCPPFPLLPSYVSLVGGSALTAAQALITGAAKTTICWDGGRHHAQKGEAAGFCYVADCVLALMAFKRAAPRSISPQSEEEDVELLNATRITRKSRTMYIDLDLHFSDAVSQAFVSSNSHSPQILTLSIHHASPGFYPPSPFSSLPTNPTSPTFNPYTLSIPLHSGFSNTTYSRLWHSIVRPLKDTFSPDYIVLQCGVDALAGDPCGVGNLSLGAMGEVVRDVMAWGLPTMMLGGGGYHTPNAARAWAFLTSVALGEPLDLESDIPDHAGFPVYGPSFTLDVPAGMMQDKNTDAYLEEVEARYVEVVSVLRERMERSQH